MSERVVWPGCREVPGLTLVKPHVQEQRGPSSWLQRGLVYPVHGEEHPGTRARRLRRRRVRLLSWLLPALGVALALSVLLLWGGV